MASIVRLNRKGRLQRIFREHYLRDDISCGSSICQQCQSNDEVQRLAPVASGQKYLVVDSVFILQQYDLLESRTGLFDNIIILQTVLDEVKNQQPRIYHKLRRLIANADSSLTNEIEAAVQSFRGLKSAADLELESSMKPVRIAVFHNEHHRQCWSERRSEESMEHHRNRLIVAACRYLAQHWSSLCVGVHLIAESKELQDLAQIDNQAFQQFTCSSCHAFGLSLRSKCCFV